MLTLKNKKKYTIEYEVAFRDVCGQSRGVYRCSTLSEALEVLRSKPYDGGIIKYKRHAIPIECKYTVVRAKRNGKITVR